MEAAVRALGLPRRSRRARAGAVRGDGVGPRARRGRRTPAALGAASFQRFRVGQTRAMGSRARRALEVGRVARQGKLLRVLREVGVVGDRPATPEGARAFRLGLEELGTTFVKLGQLLSSRPDLLPDSYIAELD